MQAIEVRAERDYAIEVGVNWQEVVASIIAQHSRLIIFAPAFILEKFSLQDFASEKVELHCLPDGEEQKNVEQWQLALKHCGDLGLTRSDAVVAIGGGATTDFTGFVGASWLRGIAWYAIPTTLAAMVDAAIGGKTGLNSVHGKNLIGSFYSPAGVYIDPAFLETLSDRDLAAGLAEVIKTGLIGEAKILDLLERTPDLQGVREIATELIALSAAFKARIVSADFREGRLREILNYGHTLGHAIEKAENYTLRHGEAVAIGLVFAAELSAIAAGLDAKAVSLHRSLLTRYGLPISYEPSAISALLETMRGDKKSRGDQMRFIGLESLGNPVWLEEVTIDQITAAYGKISS